MHFAFLMILVTCRFNYLLFKRQILDLALLCIPRSDLHVLAQVALLTLSPGRMAYESQLILMLGGHVVSSKSHNLPELQLSQL